MSSMNPRQFAALCCAAASLVLVAGCQSDRSASPPASSAALPTMERVALGANGCWFKSGDPAFKAYRLAPELNSFSGRPRILLVPRKSPEARPLAVIQAEGHPARLQAFGPLLSEPVGTRIAADVQRWAAGGQGCS
ncbi:hypothetical protein [Sinorhizobium fredii]|uniref:Lipoprotein n=1 Tax=Rhizobium fredii TaxID=380 RepID=A0A844A525_RHIFR|nr:hypothetical protein [Sinorhizobium fredii]AWI57324.1 hypothetical protein AB395_00001669 [Sinorhizobium fredii CCBAU 45436]AWM25185.1 lipoprotein putative [Sinorhizobium fredii CCBAU 25509]KSV89892.1 hypothetical protein N181_13870 [Sinorhizobium fredii USDA 205]MCG5477174.1 hypothetical protein [Sinorhizobium fredii]MQW98185.1 hypothetical protein [Sinorhizobium fredii]